MAGAAGARRSRPRRRRSRSPARALPALAWTALKVGALSYGGGFVIIPLMQGDAVDAHGWMTDAEFANAVAYGQLTPGPVVHTVAIVGWAAAGLGGALLAAGVAFAPVVRDRRCSAASGSCGCARPARPRVPRRRRPGRRRCDPRRRASRSRAPRGAGVAVRPSRCAALGRLALGRLAARSPPLAALAAPGRAAPYQPAARRLSGPAGDAAGSPLAGPARSTMAPEQETAEVLVAADPLRDRQPAGRRAGVPGVARRLPARRRPRRRVRGAEPDRPEPRRALDGEEPGPVARLPLARRHRARRRRGLDARPVVGEPCTTASCGAAARST